MPPELKVEELRRRLLAEKKNVKELSEHLKVKDTLNSKNNLSVSAIMKIWEINGDKGRDEKIFIW